MLNLRNYHLHVASDWLHVYAGQDRAFRVFSAIQDQQSREMSQGKLASKAKRMRVTQEDLKLPRVIAMDACQVSQSGMPIPEFQKPSQLLAAAALAAAVAVVATAAGLCFRSFHHDPPAIAVCAALKLPMW